MDLILVFFNYNRTFPIALILSDLTGLGAGIDSFFEILLKSFIMYGAKEDKEMFEESYANIKQYMRRNRINLF